MWRTGKSGRKLGDYADWMCLWCRYATFAGLAGGKLCCAHSGAFRLLDFAVDPTDHKAAAWGLPPIDSLDMWPLLSGQTTTSPRQELLINADTLIEGEWKVNLLSRIENIRSQACRLSSCSLAR